MKNVILMLIAVCAGLLLVDFANACDTCGRARGCSVARAKSVTINKVERAPRAPLFQRRACTTCAALMPLQTFAMVPVQTVVPTQTFVPMQTFVPAPQAAPCPPCPQQDVLPQRDIGGTGGSGSAAASAGGGGAAAAASGR